MPDLKTNLVEDMVHASTKFGIFVVQELLEKSLVQQPNMTLRQFKDVLTQVQNSPKLG